MSWQVSMETVPEAFDSDRAMLQWFMSQFITFFGSRGFIFVESGEAERLHAAFWRLAPTEQDTNDKCKEMDSI